jgi:hypothetical protein
MASQLLPVVNGSRSNDMGSCLSSYWIRSIIFPEISVCFELSKLIRNGNRPGGLTHAQCLMKQTWLSRTTCILLSCRRELSLRPLFIAWHGIELDLITSHGVVRALNPDTCTFIPRLLLILHKYVFDSWVGQQCVSMPLDSAVEL